jgi:hypothetical protein
MILPHREASPLAAVISTLLIITGKILAIAVLSQLRESFSLMAEAR